MSQTEEFQVAQTENILKQLQGLDEYGYDLKNLTSVLASLHLFRQKDDPQQKDENETSTPKKDDEETSLKSSQKNEPRLIGAVSKKKNKTGPSKKTKTDIEKIASKSPSISGESVGSGSDDKSASSKTSSTKSSKRGSRGGNRRARRRRLAKQRIQAKLAADLLSRMTNDGKNKIDDGTTSSDATSQGTPNLQHRGKVVAPPPEFYKYPSISPKRDFLRDPVTGENRPVWCVTIPMVCDKTNTPFYAQCSTSKQGYCTRCGVLRKGHAKTGSVCTEQGCNERLTAKYHRWFPGLIRLEPFGKTRNMEDYAKHKDLFKKFNITWNSDDELQFVVDSYLLLKVFVVSPDFDVAPLHLERAYMIGVFAGRAFQTGALARKFLRDGLKLMNFRADYPSVMRLMANYRANIVEELNQIFFQGRFRCYFHAHQTNVEGWYDPTQVDPSTIKAYFKEICDRHMSVGCLKEEKRERKSKKRSSSSSTSRSSKSSIARVNYPKNPGRFDFAKKKIENVQESASDDDFPTFVPSAPPGFESRKSSKSSKSSKKSRDSSKKRKSKRKEETPAISYVPVYVTPQMMAQNGQMMMAPNGQPMMMAPNGQPMMMAAAPQPYADPRTSGAAPPGYQYAPVSYAMPQQQQQQFISQQPVQNYYQQPAQPQQQQQYQQYPGNDGYSYGYGYNYGNYGYGYQGYGTGVQSTGTGATSPTESTPRNGSQIGGAATPYFVPAGYGQPVDIPSETQPGAQSLNKPIYPEHFVPVGDSTNTEK